MTKEDQNIVLSLLQEQLKQEDFSTELTDSQQGPVLRTVIPLLENEQGQVLVEICALTYNDQIDLIQIFSTMLLEPGPGLDALRAQLNDWNLVAIAGAYGIYEKMGQLYHKYNVTIDTTLDLESKAAQAFLGLCVALDEMCGRIGEAISLSAGQS